MPYISNSFRAKNVADSYHEVGYTQKALKLMLGPFLSRIPSYIKVACQKCHVSFIIVSFGENREACGRPPFRPIFSLATDSTIENGMYLNTYSEKAGSKKAAL